MNDTETDPHGHADDTRLFGELRRMWEARDPMPAGLVDDVLVALETRSLADEYALLVLVEDTTELAGARGPDGVRVLEFAKGPASVMLRVSTLDDGRLRVDGWVVPGGQGVAVLSGDRAEVSTVVGAEGRFEFSAVDSGRVELRITADDPSTGTGFATDSFEL